MPHADQQTLNVAAAQALTATISPERMGTYLVAAGHDPIRALNLYMWNAQVGEAFHVSIQAVEVGLRNRINAALVAEFGQNWWDEPTFLAVACEDRRSDLDVVLRRIRNRHLDLVTGQVVAGLSFGFWAGMLQGRYNPPLWGGHLRTVFPALPENRSRNSLATAARRIAFVRNRIWHHEPIIKHDLLKDYSVVMQTLGWICPAKAEWVQAYCRVPTLLRSKP